MGFWWEPNLLGVRDVYFLWYIERICFSLIKIYKSKVLSWIYKLKNNETIWPYAWCDLRKICKIRKITKSYIISIGYDDEHAHGDDSLCHQKVLTARWRTCVKCVWTAKLHNKSTRTFCVSLVSLNYFTIYKNISGRIIK